MTTEFRVEDASCGHCKQTIEQSVARVEGVTDARFDLDRKLLQVDHDTSTSVERITAAVTAAGYTPRSLD